MRKRNRKIRFAAPHTACWRGYESAWAVARGRLYLTHFSAKFRDGTQAKIDDLFVNYTQEFYRSAGALDPANAGPGHFAFWVSGVLFCPMGQLLAYEHDGYMSVYERDLLLYFRDGFLVGSRIEENQAPAPQPDDDFEAAD